MDSDKGRPFWGTMGGQGDQGETEGDAEFGALMGEAVGSNAFVMLRPAWGTVRQKRSSRKPRYCLSKLAQVLKTRGYAQESEQYLQRVVKGRAQKRESITTGNNLFFSRAFSKWKVCFVLPQSLVKGLLMHHGPKASIRTLRNLPLGTTPFLVRHRQRYGVTGHPGWFPQIFLVVFVIRLVGLAQLVSMRARYMRETRTPPPPRLSNAIFWFFGQSQGRFPLVVGVPGEIRLSMHILQSEEGGHARPTKFVVSTAQVPENQFSFSNIPQLQAFLIILVWARNSFNSFWAVNSAGEFGCATRQSHRVNEPHHLTEVSGGSLKALASEANFENH